MNLKKVNNYAGKLVGALVSAGYYDLRIMERNDHLSIDVSEYVTIRFSEIRVYDDGICWGYLGGKFSLEFRATTKRSILSSVKL